MKRKTTSLETINGRLYGKCVTKFNGISLFDLSSPREFVAFKATAKRWCGEPIPDNWNVGDELPDLPDREFDIARRHAMSIISIMDNEARVMASVANMK